MLSTGVTLLERHWYLVAAGIDASTGEIWLGQRPAIQYARDDTAATRTAELGTVPGPGGPFRIAAWNASPGQSTTIGAHGVHGLHGLHGLRGGDT